MSHQHIREDSQKNRKAPQFERNLFSAWWIRYQSKAAMAIAAGALALYFSGLVPEFTDVMDDMWRAQLEFLRGIGK